MKLILILILVLIPVAVQAEPDIRITDNQGDVLDITSDGKIVIKIGAPDNSGGTANSPDRRITDNDGDVLNINSDGTVSITISS